MSADLPENDKKTAPAQMRLLADETFLQAVHANLHQLVCFDRLPAPIVYHPPIKTAGPVIIACPHGGRSYPEGWFTKAGIKHARSLEDCGTESLALILSNDSRSAVIAQTGRAICDLNRPENALDPLLTSQDIPIQRDAYRHYVSAGYGVIPRLSAKGEPLYEKTFNSAEIEQILNRTHRPYHHKLSHLIATLFNQHKQVILIDLHSMPDKMRPHKISADKPSFVRATAQSIFKRGSLPDFVFGNLHGATFTQSHTRLIEKVMAEMPYSWRWNSPYAGAYTTRHYGLDMCWPRGCSLSVLQIEINRGLFVQKTGQIDVSALGQIAHCLNRVLHALEADLQSTSI